ncbi:hypothetical protein GMORB2_0269 [Geosmithia morbida]|uniref:DUF7053 domain-containing protein n=1 Tax=Geosmithia morbida TaxID=1094350 RepID=A0A9P4Z0N4_9HYPO|nr:uncharacterized protein GMORB2_0269 [Geosmithia morbida]KAF4126533.1 hypothetical protein GMORB2_0269 [Geosmithia morbida]
MLLVKTRRERKGAKGKMAKHTTFSTTTPLPSDIDRDTVLSFLHNHAGMIDLNPLVRSREKLDKPPPAAAAAEAAAAAAAAQTSAGEGGDGDCKATTAWYAVTDRVYYLPGGWPGGLSSGAVSYTCAFRDLPDGMETHCFAAMGVETRSRWSVASTGGGGGGAGDELRRSESQDSMLLDGDGSGRLHLREDVDVRSNLLLAGFIRRTIIKSHGALVDTLIERVRERSS